MRKRFEQQMNLCTVAMADVKFPLKGLYRNASRQVFRSNGKNEQQKRGQ